MPFASMPAPQQATGRDKRNVAIVGVLVLALFAGVGLWAALRPGSYGASRDGCVTVNLPSTTGGVLEHSCGPQARQVCRTAYGGSGTAARLTRQQCRLAGITPARAAG